MHTTQAYQTPHLTTATTEPLNLLEKEIIQREDEIESWFEDQWKLTPAPVYGSVDLRNAGFKLAPVDMNLFPAGFNNLNKEFLPLSIEAAGLAVKEIAAHAKRLLLIPENHTRNLHYWENIRTLIHILKSAGFEVKVGSVSLPEPLEIALSNGEVITLEPIVRTQNKIAVKDFQPDLILLNNDLSDGIPEIITHLDQPITPPAELGWSQRLKSGHFQYYKEVSNEFAKRIGLDPWFIAPLFRHCGQIDFMQR